MKVTVSVGGRFHIFNLAQQLFKRGYLQRFITSYPKFEVVKYGIPRKFIKSILIKEIIQRSWDKLPKFARDFIDPVPFITDIYDFFASFFVGKPDIFVGNCLFSLRCIRAAKKVGALTVLEYGSSHFLYRDQVLNNECDKYGVKKEKNNSKISERIINEFKEADYISIPSNFVKRTFIENGVLESKLIQVPYGVDLSSFKQIPKDDSVFRVIFAGGMILRKGVHYLLQAFSELNLSNSELMLIGAINEEMEPFFKKYEGKFKYLGHIPQKELYKYYSQGSVFVIMSIEEGLALVQPQAMACGLPVIATTNTGGEDIIRDGKDGFIIPIRDVEKLKEKLLYLYKNPGICKQMGQSAKERVSSGFTWDDYGEKMVMEYKRILNLRNTQKA
mgnify:CR=1 FL=1